jgi:uncharacterized membrane protein
MNNIFFILATIFGAYLCMVVFALLLVKLIFPWKSEHAVSNDENSDNESSARYIGPARRQRGDGNSDIGHRPASKQKIPWRSFGQTAPQ